MSQYYKEAKKEYVAELLETLYPLSETIFLDIWRRAKEHNTPETRVAAFKFGLEKIKNWDSERVVRLHDKVVGEHSDRFDKLLREVLKCSTRMICDASNVDHTYINLRVLESRRFIHKVYVKIARHCYMEPNALDGDKFDQQEISKHLQSFVKDSILNVVREETPFDEIMRVTEEMNRRSPSASSSASSFSSQQEEEASSSASRDASLSPSSSQGEQEHQQQEKELKDDDAKAELQDKEEGELVDDKNEEDIKSVNEHHLQHDLQEIKEEADELDRVVKQQEPRRPSPSFTEVLNTPNAYDTFNLDQQKDQQDDGGEEEVAAASSFSRRRRSHPEEDEFRKPERPVRRRNAIKKRRIIRSEKDASPES